jgi:hypothetical protein
LEARQVDDDRRALKSSVASRHRRPLAFLVLSIIFGVWLASGGASPAAAADATSVTVIAPDGTAQATAVEVTTKSGASTVDEMNSGSVFLLVRNVSVADVRLCDVEVTTPRGVEVTPDSAVPDGDCATSTTVIGPGDTLEVAYTVKVSGQVRPGKEILLFNVHVATAAGTNPTQMVERHVIASSDIETAVFGEAWALAVGIPVFFLLPGFLMLVAMSMTAQWLKASKDTSASWIAKPTDARFLVIAVTISAVTALLLYPLITGWFGTTRSYLSGYAFIDIIYVWSGSIVVGGVVGGIWAGYAKWKRDKVARESIEAATDPLGLIEYLSRHHISLLRPRLKLEGFDDASVALISGNPAEDEFWASPVIRFNYDDPLGQELTKFLANANANAGQVLSWLRGHRELVVEFDSEGGFGAPQRFDPNKAKATVLTNSQLMVEPR